VNRIACACVFLLMYTGVGIASDAAGRIVHYGHRARVAYFNYAPDYSACRIGWWQTLRYGHVRPAWGEWCW
jgi:hypothetical protein